MDTRQNLATAEMGTRARRRRTGERAKGNRVKRLVVLLVFLTVLCILPFPLMNYYLKPYAAESRPVEVEIPMGSSPYAVAQILADKKVIRHPKVFYYYTRLKGISPQFKAGTYTLDAAWPMEQIAVALTRGGRGAVVTVTIPEGFDLEQIAARIAAANLVSREEFLQAAAHGEFHYEFLNGVPEGDKRLEGFLFPDTYQFAAGATAEEIIHKMLKRFGEVYHEDYRRRAQELGLSTLEVVTMASLVEKEAKLDEERAMIAGVFYNRLKKNWKLESCATVQYLLDEPKEVLLYEDLEIDSPYNTYKYYGLPPGPIASPGRASLEAALYPAEVDYMFFRANPDGSHVFSRTLAEHNRAGASK
ncbi:MAG TPA: endolytic transglycosylase MltG [Clostridia bacterium]|nr:endolytic transglycosylase MltG [Clostridia bacterium]